jgi:hypothetical protein
MQHDKPTCCHCYALDFCLTFDSLLLLERLARLEYVLLATASEGSAESLSCLTGDRTRVAVGPTECEHSCCERASRLQPYLSILVKNLDSRCLIIRVSHSRRHSACLPPAIPRPSLSEPQLAAIAIADAGLRLVKRLACQTDGIVIISRTCCSSASPGKRIWQRVGRDWQHSAHPSERRRVRGNRLYIPGKVCFCECSRWVVCQRTRR